LAHFYWLVDSAGMHATPPSRENASALKLQNLERALGMANCSKSAQGFDGSAEAVVVLPEYGLTGPNFPTRESVRPFVETVPDPASMTVLCNRSIWGMSSPALTLASCLADRCGIDVVVDVAEVETCESQDPACPADGVWQYNTQVALRGSDGAVVGRYRKEHLYYEPAFNRPINQSAQTFVSSFGVKFGMMICFDIMFDWPASALLDDGVKDVVYSTWWVNMPPFLTGTQVQAGWANASRVNLIAAGSGEEGWRSSGSGVYPFGGGKASAGLQWVAAASLAPEAGVVAQELSATVSALGTSREKRASGSGSRPASRSPTR
jgi:predicted amidohydrolase